MAIFAGLLVATIGCPSVSAQTSAYVVNGGANTVSVISTDTNTITATIPVGTSPFGIAITPNGAYAYVTNGNDGSVSVINTATNMVVATVPTGMGAS